MTLIVLRHIQQFTRLFSRKLIPLWALAWITLHHPLRYYNPFLPPSLSLLRWGRSTLLPLSQLPCLPPADFMHPLCSPWTFSTLWQLSQSLSSQAKSITPLFDPTDLRRTLFGALLKRLQLFNKICLLNHVVLVFLLQFQDNVYRTQEILGVPFPFLPPPRMTHFPGSVKPLWWGRRMKVRNSW